MPPHDEQPVPPLVHQGDSQFRSWLNELRTEDAAFAHASLLRPDDDGEWQAAVYLLTGSPRLWSLMGPEVLAERSIAPAVRKRQDGSELSSCELTLLRWAAHLWNVYESAVQFPYELDDVDLRRWVDACLLRLCVAPKHKTGEAGGR